jgi:predicted NBD/HSP70 family sugar kinase
MIVVPSKMGRLNKRALLRRLQRLGTASRAELAKSLGLSQPTAGKIVDELLKLGVLEEWSGPRPPELVSGRARTPVRLGRPGRMLRLDRSRPRFLAIQLGVSETKLAALPVGADLEDRWATQVKTPGSAGEWVRQLRNASGNLGAKGIWGVLVSVPGIVDEQAGRILFSPNLHWTEKSELSGLIQQVWPAPVLLVQEERALALGHQLVAAENEDFLLVDFGDGVGGAIIVGGNLHANPLPISGELGHTPVLGNLRPCGCGAVGCVETLVSTRGLLASFAETQRQGPANWAALARAIEEKGIETWLAGSLDAAAMVIAGALNVLGIQRVVVTGSLTELPPAVMEHLSRSIRQGSMWARFGEVEIQAAQRRRTAGLVAAGIDRLVLPMTAPAGQEEADLAFLAPPGRLLTAA